MPANRVKDGIVSVDRQMKVSEVNCAIEGICGYSRHDAIGKGFDSLELGCNKQCLDAILKTMEKKETVEMHRLECKHDKRPDMVVTIKTSPKVDEHNNFSGAVMVIIDESRIDTLERDLKERRQFHNMIGKSEKMQNVFSLIEDLSDVDTTVLITGESGTGKELVAEAIHHRGVRNKGPFVKLNCSALSENLLESELFGHVKGAFTGAVKDKVGRFEKADGGTIFLDEIGDVSPGMQLRLLRVLQEREFERVGDSTPVKVDVRVVAATNRDLREHIARGGFREDLYYRLRVMELNLPPLRERREDIPLLTECFISKFNKKFGKNINDVSDEVNKIFLSYPWPGNIRELEHSLEHAFILCRHNTIRAEHLPPELRDHMQSKGLKGIPDKGDERQLLIDTLEKSDWNKAKAARMLGISRITIYRKIEKYNIAPPSIIFNM